MEIKEITVEYSELRSSGYPNFSNKKYGLSVSATVGENETPKQVKDTITKNIIDQVKMFFGDKIDGIPF